MASTFKFISKVEVGSGGAASIDFTSIPSTYTDLILKVSARSTTTGLYSGYQTPLFARFNSSGSNYSMRWVQAEGGSSTNSGTEYFGMTTTYAFFGTAVPSDWTSSVFNNNEIYIPKYGSNIAKTFSVDSVSENNGSFGSLVLNAGLWNDTGAITSISLTLERGNLAQYSNAYLYGVTSS